MMKPSIMKLMQIGMFAFFFACIGGAIAVFADLYGYLYWARIGFTIVVLGVVVGGLVVFFGIVMNFGTIVLGGIDSFRILYTRGLSATIEEAKRRLRE